MKYGNIHCIISGKGKRIFNFEPFYLSMVTVLLRAYIVYILAVGITFVPADNTVVGHIAVAFQRTVSEIAEFIRFIIQLKLKAESRQPY